jgi:tRNA(His) 5'-end guanylyltransferase
MARGITEEEAEKKLQEVQEELDEMVYKLYGINLG